MLKIAAVILSAMLVEGEPNESQAKFQDREEKVQARLEEFERTDNYELLLEAQRLSSSTNPRGSKTTLAKLDEDTLRLQLKVLVAIAKARDSHYDPKAKESVVYLNVMPPLTGKSQGYAAGMSPEGIKDPEERKAYEEAIAENNRRGAKANRELYLSRGVDRAVMSIWYFVRTFPADSPARRSAFGIIEATVSDEGIRNRLKSESRPGLTR